MHREYYLNDRGVQMQPVRRVARRAPRPDRTVPEDGYPGEYVREWAAEMPDDADPARVGLRAGAGATCRESARRASASTFDTWFSEQSLVESAVPIDATLDDLRDRGVVFEADGAIWLRTTDFGDDKDRVLVKSDGEPTYLLPDIAYHRDKFARGFELLIDVWGADHHGYVAAPEGRRRRRSATIPTSSRSSSASSCSLVRDGEAVRLSKRAGDLVLLDDLSTRSAPTSPASPSCCSRSTRRQTDRPRPDHRPVEREPGLLRAVRHTPGSTRSAARPPRRASSGCPLDTRRPVAARRTSASSTCSARSSSCPTSWRWPAPTGRRTRSPPGSASWPTAFHGFYHDCYVIGEDVPPELTQARLWLVEAARIGLAIGLDLLGVSAPESM